MNQRLAKWYSGARPRTLPAAVVPVAVATAIAWWTTRVAPADGSPQPHVVWWRAVAALVVALAIQIGTNYANDYSDGVRGTDSRRVGPVRLVASELATPAAVRRAAIVSFAVAGLAGLALAAATSWWVLAAGASCFLAGWLYTGGPRPYGYLGLGELFVFVYFGIVATVGTVYVETGRFPAVSFVASVCLGMLSCCLLEANNIRDIESDAASQKRTLAVRLGRRRAGWTYAGFLAVAAIAILGTAAWNPWALLGLLAAPIAIAPLRLVLGGAEGRELLEVLAATGKLQLATGALLAAGFVVGGATR